MVTMTWEYVAGFTDGEGYIGRYRCKTRTTPKKYYKYDRCRFMISQVERNKKAIYELEKFLKDNGINCHVYSYHYKSHKNPMHILQISHHVHLKNFLLEIYPYLIVKKEDALDMINYISNRSWEYGH